MRRVEAQSIGDIIDEFLKHENLTSDYDEHRALALWPQIVGAGINRYTVSRSVRAGVMTVQIASAPLRNELMLNRSAIIRRINESLGREVITEIIFK